MSPFPPTLSSLRDRQPYQWDPAAPLNLYPAQTNITRNLFISNYHSTWPIDHDDGSNAYYDANNLLAWGGAKNYLGFAKRGHSNFYLYPDAQEPTASSPAGGALPRIKTGFSPYCYGSAGSATLPARLRDASTNCTCVAGSAPVLYSLDCDASHVDNGYVPVLANNSYFLDSGDYAFPCGSARWNLTTAQANGVDLGTVVAPSPGTQQLLALMAAFVETQLKQ